MIINRTLLRMEIYWQNKKMIRRCDKIIKRKRQNQINIDVKLKINITHATTFYTRSID